MRELSYPDRVTSAPAQRFRDSSLTPFSRILVASLPVTMILYKQSVYKETMTPHWPSGPASDGVLKTLPYISGPGTPREPLAPSRSEKRSELTAVCQRRLRRASGMRGYRATNRSLTERKSLCKSSSSVSTIHPPPSFASARFCCRRWICRRACTLSRRKSSIRRAGRAT